MTFRIPVSDLQKAEWKLSGLCIGCGSNKLYEKYHFPKTVPNNFNPGGFYSTGMCFNCYGIHRWVLTIGKKQNE